MAMIKALMKKLSAIFFLRDIVVSVVPEIRERSWDIGNYTLKNEMNIF
jgi:hypothetical protein